MPSAPRVHATERESLPGPAEPRRVYIAGHRFHDVTEQGCIDYVMESLAVGRGGWIGTHNLDHLLRLRRDEPFRSLCATADLAVADGAPIVWASALQGDRLPGRVAGSDLISSLSAGAAEAGHSIYLLGGNRGAAGGAAEELQRRFPGLRIAGTAYPEFGFERDPEQLQRIVADLKATQPAIVYVALGSPKQELLIGQIGDQLPEAWWIGIGISFSFLTGEVQRAPRWMQKLGLEWVHRMCQEPRRLARRYLVDGIPFALQLFAMSLWARLRRSPDQAVSE